MVPPFYVYVFCEGRLANQLLAWANGRYVTRNLANRKLLMNYAPLAGHCVMPDTEFVQNLHPEPNVKEWPTKKTAELADTEDHCVWTEAWQNHPPGVVMLQHLHEIGFDAFLVAQANALIENRPLIGVHIRYGDYVAIDEDNPPMIRPPFVRAPNRYYTDRLDQCLERLPNWPVFLATDGTDDEVAWFTEKYHPLRQPKNDGLLDFLTLMRCRIIICSASTYGPLAAGLSGIPWIHPETGPERVPGIINNAKELQERLRCGEKD